MNNDPFDIIRLRDEGDGDLAFQLETTAGLLDDHPAYRNQNHPPWVVGPTHLRECAVELKQASVAAKHDNSKEPERLLARDNAIQSLTFTGQFVFMFSVHAKDPTVLEIGLDLRHRSFTKDPPTRPEKPSKFTVKHTGVSGCIYASINAWEGKGSVELQICEGDPADEAAWRILDIFHSCRMRASGLEPASKCHFRARIQNDAGKGPWSEVVDLIIL